MKTLLDITGLNNHITTLEVILALYWIADVVGGLLICGMN